MSFGKLGAMGRGFGHLGALGRAGTSNPKNTIVASPGGYVFTGQGATLAVQKILAAAGGSYVFAGQSASLTKSSKTMAADTGAYAWSGDPMTPVVDHLLPADAGLYVFGGQAATLTKTGGASTSYVTGDRLSSITVTTDLINGDPGALVDGDFTQGQNGTPPYGSCYFNGEALDSSKRFIFDFSTPKVVDEARWYQDSASPEGTWQWYGSTDGTTLTAAIGSSFTLGTGASYPTPQTMTTLNGNTTAYRYYIMAGVSGSTDQTPWLIEIEFKQD